MGFLTSAEAVIAAALSEAMAPPPPPDITRWCEENIVFDERSPMPGPFRIERFPFLREIHEVLSPEHPCREVTVRGSAQWGKTVSVLNPVIGAWHEYGPLDSLVVHPTHSSATEWVDNKWLPMRRQAPSLRRLFGDGRGGDNKDAKFNQETLTRNGSLKVTSAGSPDDLAGTSRRLVALDDLSKFEMTPKGDPEKLAESRASGFEDAKILAISTAQLVGTCRISRRYERSDKRLFDVPCPHCGHMAPLTWENFRRNLDPERLHAACFTCDDCGGVIGHADKERIVGLGKWVATNPAGDHPGFHLWRAYVPQRDWASIAVEYARVMGWTQLSLTGETEEAIAHTVEAETEQTFWNDVLGLPYAVASKGPDWEKLRDRVENQPEGEGLPRSIVPARGVILTAGVDCQGDRTEIHIVAHGPNHQRWPVDYIVVPHHIADEACWSALDGYLKATWRTERGLRLPLDMLAIDGGTYTDAVWSWATRWPWDRVIVVKGSNSANGPTMVPQKFERRADGKAKRRQKRAFMLNVSQLKGDFYGWLEKDDPLSRGYVHFARGLGDEYYRMVTSEVRVLRRSSSGVVNARWELVEPTRRNEGLDTMLYAEAGARRKGWLSLTAEQWLRLEAERGAAPTEDQPDLFDAGVTVAPATDGRDAQPVQTRKRRVRGQAG
ncbi:phage terminase large subunit family protein [Sagittula sp. MA-2]|jgi:phage terminase large subunit GpA-like protein|uniref:phage terminase large subunit family protein n=1 Tax=Sagittula sp. MA-2 TaxID=3048007 RepID=UPI0024C2DA58|nr:terminase gpA endonuclease subunit [Sagittula sp. MA-2]WHZ33419.1 phage terminase large subunit family protein [Sagittula sp. MA-2]